MRADEHVGGRRCVSFAFRGRAREQRAGDPELAADRLDRQEVLLGKRLGRGHQRALSPVLDCAKQRVERDHGLSGANVALQEPMGNAVHATFVEPIEGRTVAITGCGPIGLCTVGIAKAAGAAMVIATDVEPYRLEIARSMGADMVADAREPDMVQRVLDATGGDGVEVVIEMSGAQAALDSALGMVTRGGRISLLGIFSRPVQMDLSDLVIQKGIRLYGIYGRRIYDTWDRTQALLRGGLDVSPVLTHRLDLADWERGFDLIASRHAGKVVLLP